MIKDYKELKIWQRADKIFDMEGYFSRRLFLRKTTIVDRWLKYSIMIP